jgi:hypothetical protein
LFSSSIYSSFSSVRYSRLGRTRARLGYIGPPDTFQDEDKVSFDENYMACDLVINWAAESLVLCFIHAVTGMLNSMPFYPMHPYTTRHVAPR